ncbi:hypothetical protein PR202_gb00060 [Eleusine coracana subsp. coracana]|uniref:Uncharacterized protein n=1 Tax=Eleusine coracana subsp. coracana TaxID=191504 RepID=A0AAV5DSN3_ELECO|nr:hypothetical protein PR202_gb00060 [Eleusine coracana subsp. coracana]
MMRNQLCRAAGGVDTVLEVPVPDLHNELPPPPWRGGRLRCRRRRSRTVIKAWVRSLLGLGPRCRLDGAPSQADVQLMLLVIGAPLVPQPVEAWKGMTGKDVAEQPLEVSKARYVVEWYVAAVGGTSALNPVAASMCAAGNVWMRTSKGSCCGRRGRSCGACRADPGLDPKSTADLFSTAAWAGEKRFDDNDCFVLRVDAAQPTLHARSRAGVEVVRHALLGYFSQRTGLLVGLEDTHLVRAVGACWETAMASSVGDYRRVDGVSVAHAGRTVARLTRFDAGSRRFSLRGKRRRMTRTCMEEAWSIEEVGFNVVGLCTECFLPPRDMVPCDGSEPGAPPGEERVVFDGSGEKDVAAAASSSRPPNSAVATACDVAVPEVIGEFRDDVTRPAVWTKLRVPAVAKRLVGFGLANSTVAAVRTINIATEEFRAV